MSIEASFTKYDDDTFVMRMNREQAEALMALLGKSCGDNVCTGGIFSEFVSQLGRDAVDRVSRSTLHTTGSDGNRVSIPNYRLEVETPPVPEEA